MSRLIVSWLLSQYGVQISELEGVLEVKEAHFWTLCSGEYHGSLRLEITGGTDSQRTVATTRSILTQVEEGIAEGVVVLELILLHACRLEFTILLSRLLHWIDM